MKSEFALAFNQICAEYGLPREIVLEAVQAALVTAYRRDWKVGLNQNVNAEIDLDTGLARIFLEKNVVEEVDDVMVEVAVKKIRRTKPRAEVGDIVMVDVTPSDFGRIAAQTAKQVILQRLKEAERESQFSRFSRQENEIIIGTIQAVKPHGVILHLERTEEARMPKREQIPGERYILHQKIRVYVLEVKRTPRGPEIIVSRSHPLMLRRLLELEVPEIRTGQVEIMGIAREAGGRSKVAVVARQAGLDPVGACVGMRGIRIQTISRELHGERIDVIEWNEDPAKFISHALSMKQIVSVVLDENNPGGRTASVVVVDDQLSLAIGRAGQNARLAAKLTGWRVDIQGVTEAAIWAIEEVNKNPDLLEAIKGAALLVPRLASIMRSHEQDRYPYTDEELKIIKQVSEAVREARIAQRDAERPGARQERARRSAQERAEAARRQARQQAKKKVPESAYETKLEALDLSEKVLGHLKNNNLSNVGQVMERMALGDEELLVLQGIGVKALGEIKEAVEQSALDFVEAQAVTEEVEMVQEDVAEEAVVAAEEVVEEVAAEEIPELVEEPALEPVADVEVVVAAEVEGAVEDTMETAAEAVAEAEETAAAESEPAEGEEEAPWEEPEFDIADVAEVYSYEESDEEYEDEDDFSKPGEKRKRRKKKGRTIVFDEESGETFTVHKRRRSQRFEDMWEDYIE